MKINKYYLILIFYLFFLFGKIVASNNNTISPEFIKTIQYGISYELYWKPNLFAENGTYDTTKFYDKLYSSVGKQLQIQVYYHETKVEKQYIAIIQNIKEKNSNLELYFEVDNEEVYYRGSILQSSIAINNYKKDKGFKLITDNLKMDIPLNWYSIITKENLVTGERKNKLITLFKNYFFVLHPDVNKAQHFYFGPYSEKSVVDPCYWLEGKYLFQNLVMIPSKGNEGQDTEEKTFVVSRPNIVSNDFAQNFKITWVEQYLHNCIVDGELITIAP